MEADVIHDYLEWPKDEIKNTKKVIENDDNHKLVDVIRTERNLGAEKAYLAILLYKEVK